jgi:hypothetical protein
MRSFLLNIRAFLFLHLLDRHVRLVLGPRQQKIPLRIVRGFRSPHEIAVYREGEWAERGEITLEPAAKIIGVHKMTVLRVIKRGDIKGRQPCPEAPWVINADGVAAFAAMTPPKR